MYYMHIHTHLYMHICIQPPGEDMLLDVLEAEGSPNSNNDKNSYNDTYSVICHHGYYYYYYHGYYYD